MVNAKDVPGALKEDPISNESAPAAEKKKKLVRESKAHEATEG